MVAQLKTPSTVADVATVTAASKPSAVTAFIYIPNDAAESALWKCNHEMDDLEGQKLVVLQIVALNSTACTDGMVPIEQVKPAKALQFRSVIVNQVRRLPALPHLATDFESVTVSQVNTTDSGFESFLSACMESKALKNLRLMSMTLTKKLREAFHRRFFAYDLEELRMREVHYDGFLFGIGNVLVTRAMQHWVEAKSPVLRKLELETQGKVEMREKVLKNLPNKIRATIGIYEAATVETKCKYPIWKFQFEVSK